LTEPIKKGMITDMKTITIYLIALFCLCLKTFSFNYAIWHWHLNYHFDPDSLKTLAEIPISDLYYHAGNFAFIRQKPDFETTAKRQNFIADFSSLQQFKSIHLCYTFGNSPASPFVTEFLNKDAKKGISYITERLQEDFLFYQTLNNKVQGIQIDLEGGNINFTVYQELLTEIKKVIPQALISITPMSSWIKRPEFRKLAKKADFIVPMLYDFHRGKRAEDDLKVTDYNWLKKMVAAWDELEKPIVYGLPTYSYSILYDHTGQMRVPWAVYNPETITENRRFELQHFDFNRSGFGKESRMTRDRVLSYMAMERFSFSNQNFEKGSIFKYNFISAQALNEYIEAIKSSNAKYGHGVAFFRYGRPTEALVLSAERLKLAVTGNFHAPLSIKLERINTESQQFFLSFTNEGSPSYFGKTGFTVEMPKSCITGHTTDFDHLNCPAKDNKNCLLEEEYFNRGETLISPLLNMKCLEMHLKFVLKNGTIAERTVTTTNFPSVLK
jgi:hypothetical protein